MDFSDGISDRHVLTRGVTQGGVLSPLLFNIALISLSKPVQKNVKISMHADDIFIGSSGHNRKEICSPAIYKQYCRTSSHFGFALTPGKYSAMAFSIDVRFLNIQLK